MRGKLWFSAATIALMIGSPAFAQDADQPGDASTQARLAAGQALDGAISPAGDTDWFRLRVEQGQRYALTLDGVPNAEGGAIDPVLSVYDAQGDLVAQNDDANGSLNSALQYVPSQGGDVFVEARGFSSEATGAYRLNVTAETLPADDAGNDAHTRATASVGRATTGNIEYEGDVDWYRFNARTGQRYHITLDGAEGREDGLRDPFLRVLDRDGEELAVNDDADGLNSAVDLIVQRSGPVFIEARAFADSYAGAYTLNITAERLPPDNASNDSGTRGRISVGQTVDASLDFPGDRDWYRIRLEQGQSYRFRLSSGEGESALGDPLLKLRGPSGEELAMDDDGGGGLNSFLEFTAPTTGNYFLEASGFNSEATGGYRLSAAAGDIPADTTTDVTLSADGDIRPGTLSPAGDHDWYRLDLAEGQGVRIGLTGGDADGLGDPFLVIHGPDGQELAHDDDGGEGLNSWLEFTAATAGPHYVEVRGFGEEAQGRYVIALASGEIGESPDSAEALDATSEGRVGTIGAPGDVDWFSIAMVEGRPYRIYVDGVEPNALADPLLKLYDIEGNEIAMDDDGGAGLGSYINYTSVTGGIYFAAVSSYDQAGVGRYLVRATDTDVPGGVDTDEFLDASNDERLGRIDIPGDLDSYRVELEQGVRYTIEVRGAGERPLGDPFLAVVNYSNEVITSDDDSGPGYDARLRFTPREAGTYFLRVSGLAGSAGDYRISITRQ